jgi:hypothetical protein
MTRNSNENEIKPLIGFRMSGGPNLAEVLSFIVSVALVVVTLTMISNGDGAWWIWLLRAASIGIIILGLFTPYVSKKSDDQVIRDSNKNLNLTLLKKYGVTANRNLVIVDGRSFSITKETVTVTDSQGATTDVYLTLTEDKMDVVATFGSKELKLLTPIYE